MPLKETERAKEQAEEIAVLTKKLVGAINSLDSRGEKSKILADSVDNLIAGVEIAKVEKAGILISTTIKRASFRRD